MTDAVTTASASIYSGWVDGRTLWSYGTNSRSRALPFQRWVHFKEAFAPEVVARALADSGGAATSVLDPFGGSGTTGLAAQFLGLRPTLLEVNPFLADLIRAKLYQYNLDELEHDVTELIDFIARPNQRVIVRPDWLQALPPTFVEPGRADRYLFARDLANLIGGILARIDEVTNAHHRRLFRVLIGGRLVQVSNARVNGKGRRYRGAWQDRQMPTTRAAEIFARALADAFDDIRQYHHKPMKDFEVLAGDARTLLPGLSGYDLAIFSPPYPNSFDYTDVYNIELWMLGYLSTREENRELRAATLTSHVQIHRAYAPHPSGSRKLDATIEDLMFKRDQLWNANIPEMVGAYFAEMVSVMTGTIKALTPSGEAWMVVGDSRYAGVHIPVADVLAELASAVDIEVVSNSPFRSMRTAPQQGGSHALDESLIVLRR